MHLLPKCGVSTAVPDALSPEQLISNSAWAVSRVPLASDVARCRVRACLDVLCRHHPILLAQADKRLAPVAVLLEGEACYGATPAEREEFADASRIEFVKKHCLSSLSGQRAEAASMRVQLLGANDGRVYLIHVVALANVLDERSSWIILQALRESLQQDTPSPLPVAPQYDDIIANRLTLLSAMHNAGSLSERHPASTELPYWRSALDGTAPLLQIPTDLSPSSVHSLQRRRCLVRLQKSDIDRFVPSATISATVLSALSVVLQRRSGENELAILSSNVPDSSSGCIGPLQNSVLLRIPVDVEQPFGAGLLADVSSVLGHAHQQLLNISELNIIVSGHVDVTSLEVGYEAQRLPVGLEPASLRRPEGVSSSLRLLFTLYEKPESDSWLSCDFDATVYVRESIEELLQQVSLVLQQANDDAIVRQLSLVTPGARRRLPDPHRKLDQGWPGPITEVFDANAVLHPQRPAIVSQTNSMSYARLKVLSDALAQLLLKSGIGVGDVVAIYGHRSSSVVVAILGVLKSGAAYCILDPKYPPDRIVALLDVAQPCGWIRLEAAGEVPELVAKRTRGFAFNQSLPRYIEHWTPNVCTMLKLPKIEQDTIAVVTFTSGSTGIPKGVCGRHVSLTHFYPWMSLQFSLTCEDRFSMCSGIAHDPLQRDIFTPLFLGAQIAIPEEETMSNPGALARWMLGNRITISCLTPAMGQVLTCGFETEADVSTCCLEDLRCVFFVGDLLIKRDVLRLMRLAPNVHCINMYGSTETQRAVGFLELSDASVLSNMKEVIPVGSGMKDIDMLLLNKAGKLAGVGELAEIYVRSPHLSAGYLGLPEETRARFVQNPFTNVSGDRMYKTGDLGRYMVSGCVECNGRVDDQVKLRGFRVELGEINAFLSKQEWVDKNVTVLRKEIDSLASYVVLTRACVESRRSHRDIVDVLRAHLSASLPSYMVPAHFVILDTMPLTPNGKINRPALPTPVHNHHRRHKTELSGTELALQELWCRTLDVEQCEVDDNFFEIGGHSLLATLLTLRICKSLHEGMNVAMLLENPSIASLAKAIDAQHSAPDARSDLDLCAHVSEVGPFGREADPTLMPFVIDTPIRTVLLSGATGFLGAFLLASLLRRSSDLHVICVVRASDDDKALARVRQSLEDHQLWRQDLSGRFEALAGDLALPRLGLARVSWQRLCVDVDSIVHNGALVHWLTPYERMKPVNVDGTVTMLELASSHRIKSMHYVSTTAVYGTNALRSLSSVCEEALERRELQLDYDGLQDGYAQSKWVAEQIVLKARRQGIPVGIYRPGYVTGHSKSGVCNTDDFICRLIKGCIQLGATPFKDADGLGTTLDLSPVDYVTDVIAHCSLNASANTFNKSFNVVNGRNATTFEELFDVVRRSGYDLVPLSYSDWRQRLFSVASRTLEGAEESNALLPLLNEFSPDWIDSLARPIYENENVNAAIAGSDIAVPNELQSMIESKINYLVQCGFMNAPHGREVQSTASVKLLSRTNRNA